MAEEFQHPNITLKPMFNDWLCPWPWTYGPRLCVPYKNVNSTRKCIDEDCCSATLT